MTTATTMAPAAKAISLGSSLCLAQTGYRPPITPVYAPRMKGWKAAWALAALIFGVVYLVDSIAQPPIDLIWLLLFVSVAALVAFFVSFAQVEGESHRRLQRHRGIGKSEAAQGKAVVWRGCAACGSGGNLGASCSYGLPYALFLRAMCCSYFSHPGFNARARRVGPPFGC